MTKRFCDYCHAEVTNEGCISGQERGFYIDGTKLSSGSITLRVYVNDRRYPTGAQPDMCLACLNKLLAQGVEQ